MSVNHQHIWVFDEFRGIRFGMKLDGTSSPVLLVPVMCCVSACRATASLEVGASLIELEEGKEP